MLVTFGKMQFSPSQLSNFLFTHLLLFCLCALDTKRAFPFTLALRIRRICSSDKTFKLLSNEQTQYFNELTQYSNLHGYNLSLVNQGI